MPPKRKAPAPESPEDSKKVKSNAEESNDEIDLNCSKIYRQVYDHVVNQTDHEGRSLSEMFATLPSKHEFAIYYDIIEEPIDFKTIKKKITTKQYSFFDDFEQDVLLLIKNAHTFNEPRSQISKDATALKRAFYSKKQEFMKPSKTGRKRAKSRTMSVDSEDQHEDGQHEVPSEVAPELESEDSMDTKEAPPKQTMESVVPKIEAMSIPVAPSPITSSVSTPSEPQKDDGLIDQNFEHNVFSILYNTVVAYTDASGRRLSQPFLRLLNKRCYPDYYELIKKPLSLTKTRTKIKQGYYSDIHILGRDLCLVFENAMLYNKPGSVLYADALTLRNFMLEKKDELAATEEYLELRENLPKRGRQKLLKLEETGDTPKRSRNKQKEANVAGEVGAPDTSDKKSLKKKLAIMYTCVAEYKDSEGRILCSMFEELPDEKEYPEYYRVIPNPIDMKTIHAKLQGMLYSTEDEFIHDFEVMFQNARHFNEETSEVYMDSVTLEKALKKKRRWLNHVAENKSPLKGPRASNSPSLPALLGKRSGEFANKCQELLYHVRTFMDESGRMLSEIFEKLPSRTEYPDYYLLIKKPIDLVYIASRLNKYTTLDDFEQDMLLLFNNACQYNDPDSQIYKDALTLLRVMLKKKKEIVQHEHTPIPNVPAMVQSLLSLLYTNIMQHKDEEGRLYADSLLEIEVISTEEESRRKPISLPRIGQLLKLGFYKRLDRLQDDMFSIFEKARTDGRTDSEIYEDSCELQIHFMMERDRLTKDGVRLMTQAVNTTLKKVQSEMDAERKEKQQKESQDDDEDDESFKKNRARFKGVTAIEVQPEEGELDFAQSVSIDGIEYRIGDYVYVTPEEPSRPPHIMSVEKVWLQKDGLKGIYGSWFYRPEATFHLASRKFMEKEVFRSFHCSYILTKGVIGHCFVMSVKEYPKFKPAGFEDKDIYVCESRYNGKSKTFKKLKTFPVVPNHVTIIDRLEAIQIKRVSSVFNANQQGGDDKKDDKQEFPALTVDITSLEEYGYPPEKNSEIEVPNASPGCTYYEKYVTGTDVYKTGDGVYVLSDESFKRLAKIERIWKKEDGEAYCHCIMFVFPEDTKNTPTQLFSENECFESNVEEDIPISSICGKCAVLNLRDYQSCRPTELAEDDVYLCSATYNEDELKFRRNIRGCKRLQLPQNIRDDEYWYFDQPYNPRRRPSMWLIPNKEFQGKIENETVLEKNDQTDEQVIDMEKIGFTLFKRELVTSIMRATPNIPVSELDRISDEKWKVLTDEQRIEFKDRAKRQGLGEHLYVYQCAWASCEHQYEDLKDLMIHVIEGPHLVRCPETGLFPCKWKDCEREKRQLKSLKTHSQLIRHIREIHFKKAARTKIIASDKSKFYFPASQACDDSFRDSETSSRASVTSPLSPRVPPPNGHHFPPTFAANNMTMPNSVANGVQQHAAAIFPPFRMSNQAQNSAAFLMQQQIYQQQQQMLLQAARRPMAPQPQAARLPLPTTPNNPLMQQQPQPTQVQTPISMSQQTPQPPNAPQAPPQMNGGPGVPHQPHGLTPEQQQMLLIQVQQQHHQIMKLQEQVKTLNTNAQLQQQQQQQQPPPASQIPTPKPPTPVAHKTPVFVTPPTSNSTKLRHSEAYLRYIEGLRDNQNKLSNWSELANAPNKPRPPSAQLPVHWLGNDHGFQSATDALWALRDHMIKDSITLSKYT